ncbi:triose-phosphate isomerase [Acidocella sp.]|uniref:triose-phosphate isomerase n=1 Tax=Acidocella sp. TaxID=50710 RepID=UPI003D04D9A8
MRQLIAGNWKMFGKLADVPAYASAVLAAPTHVDLLVCPPFTLLDRFAAALKGSQVALGGQDCHANPQGAHTGDIAAPMLAEVGARYVILGHSERRNDHGEANAVIRAKTEAAMAAGLIPIVCVGETEAEREAGEAMQVVRSQLQHSLPAGFAGVAAYEPVWAIGTGRTPTETDITAMHADIRAALLAQLGEAGAKIQILYGGSVKPGNAASLLALPEVGGALVGGASLKAEDFLAIANAAPRG